MKQISSSHISLLKSENYQRPNVWDDTITPYLLRSLFPSILGGILGAMIVARLIISYYAQ